ncbi:protein JTB isoform X2 [Protopterus annectens]|uniref:protein JTB isoform X2 n=1 Tax=Protopterus annectens TaxID=7888 RepID=UPI001CFC351E|nr:protein JTB isoform X2 [Protopterus annectens]
MSPGAALRMSSDVILVRVGAFNVAFGCRLGFVLGSIRNTSLGAVCMFFIFGLLESLDFLYCVLHLYQVRPNCQLHSLRSKNGIIRGVKISRVYVTIFLNRSSEGAVLQENKASESTAVATPCWQVEEFVVAQECGLCTDFQKKTMEVCHTTGFVEKINCALSKKDEYKSCRSAKMEDEVFWKFEGAMAGVAVMFAIVVIFRQRSLDKLASEKVRKQLESI